MLYRLYFLTYATFIAAFVSHGAFIWLSLFFGVSAVVVLLHTLLT